MIDNFDKKTADLIDSLLIGYEDEQVDAIEALDYESDDLIDDCLYMQDLIKNNDRG